MGTLLRRGPLNPAARRVVAGRGLREPCGGSAAGELDQLLGAVHAERLVGAAVLSGYATTVGLPMQHNWRCTLT